MLYAMTHDDIHAPQHDEAEEALAEGYAAAKTHPAEDAHDLCPNSGNLREAWLCGFIDGVTPLEDEDAYMDAWEDCTSAPF